MSKYLRTLMGKGPLVTERAPMFPVHVAYVHPNPDGSRKMCENCFLWQQSDNGCFIHEAGIVATPESVCDYHVYGRPFQGGDGDFLQRTNMSPVTPEESGLEQVPEGTSCDRCRYYESQGSLGGLCLALDDPDNPGAHPPVEALGCCNRFELLE